MEDRKVVGIMACDPSGVIGAGGGLPWQFESEMQHFLQVISGGVLIMGRKTFESLPQSLKDSHRCVVFSGNSGGRRGENKVVFVSSLEEFELLEVSQQSKLFMIGGAEIAHLFLQNNLIAEFILTIMSREYSGDTKLDLNLLKNWTKEILNSCDDYTVYRYVPILYKIRDKK